MKCQSIKHLGMIGILALAGVARSEVEISRFSIDGGGTMFSTGGDFELSGTIGQPDASVLTGGNLILSGGFWFQVPPGDCNHDGVTSLLDLPTFQDCMTGPLGAQTEGPCQCYDLDRSGLVDLFDFGMVQTAFGGQ